MNKKKIERNVFLLLRLSFDNACKNGAVKMVKKKIERNVFLLLRLSFGAPKKQSSQGITKICLNEMVFPYQSKFPPYSIFCIMIKEKARAYKLTERQTPFF